MTDQLNEVEQAFEVLQEKLSQCAQAGRFMVAIWRLDEKDILHLDRVTYGFPLRDMEQASKMLAVDLKNEIRPAIDPLAQADVSHLIRGGNNN